MSELQEPPGRGGLTWLPRSVDPETAAAHGARGAALAALGHYFASGAEPVIMNLSMGSVSRALERRSENTKLQAVYEQRVRALELLHEQAWLQNLPPVGSGLDAARRTVLETGVVCDREGWRLRLSVRPCGETKHWHLVASSEELYKDSRSVLRELQALRMLGVLMDLTCQDSDKSRPPMPLLMSPLPSRAHHFDWHADREHARCPLLPQLQRVLLSMRKAARRR